MTQERYIEFALGALVILTSLLQFWMIGPGIEFPFGRLIA